MKKSLLTSAVSALALMASSSSFAELTANVSVTNNYIWRGLTQSINEGAVQGGIDYASESGFYAGTWTSNVSYDAQDAYSYEHDMYFGFAGEASGLSYDIGYLYYNYDENAGFDFGEVYATIGMGPASVTAYFLTNAEPEESDFPAAGWDFDAFGTFYLSGDYTIPLASGAEVGLHLGYHEGDFAEAFNGVGLGEGYFDYNISIAKDGFSFMVTSTDLGDDDDNDGIEDYASMAPRDNDNVKFVVGYALDFTL